MYEAQDNLVPVAFKLDYLEPVEQILYGNFFWLSTFLFTWNVWHARELLPLAFTLDYLEPVELKLQRSAKKYANLAKQDPARARQNR